MLSGTEQKDIELAFLNGFLEIFNGLISCCTNQDQTMNEEIEFMANIKKTESSLVKLTYQIANSTKNRVFSDNQFSNFLENVDEKWESSEFLKIKKEIFEEMNEDCPLLSRVMMEYTNDTCDKEIIDFFEHQDVYVRQLLAYESGRDFGIEFIRETNHVYENYLRIRQDNTMIQELKKFRHLLFSLIEKTDY